MPEKQDAGTIFALDIGTRSIIGVLGKAEKGRFHVTAIEKEEHGRRAMLDGQIVEIEQVAAVAKTVLQRLEAKSQLKLQRVCVAAAGRALRSQEACFSLEFPELRVADADLVGQLEAGAVSAAERALSEQAETQDRFYMVGYTARQYRLDGYPLGNLLGHRGRRFEVDVVSTFLPCGVVESLYAVVSRLGLEVSSLTLEPIASLNACIPEDIRLLNLVLADIGAGTSDLAVCREGSVVGYTMATVAGDEVTEALMKGLLVDFKTAERLKLQIGSQEPQPYSDILGLKHEADPRRLWELAQPAAQRLAKEIAAKVLELNGAPPSAVFLAGGGAKLQGLSQLVAEELEMGESRVALAGRHFESSAYSDEYELGDPEFATPLGIGISAALGMINDSYMITLNGSPAKLFRSGLLTLRDVLLMNGYHYGDMMGRTGSNLTITLNGQRKFFRGEAAVPAKILRNGEEAALSDVVHAGDRVDFTPAVQGRSASPTLLDLLGPGFTGLLRVNGEPQSLRYRLCPGDSVEARADAAAPTKPPLAAGKPAIPEAPPAPPLEQKPAPVEKKAPPASQTAAPDPLPPAPKKEPQREELAGQMAFGSQSAPSGPAWPGELCIQLNGAMLRLPPKPQGNHYYLMDVLEYSGLDFQHLESPVELLVNGQPGQFTQVLRQGDDVVICTE